MLSLAMFNRPLKWAAANLKALLIAASGTPSPAANRLAALGRTLVGNRLHMGRHCGAGILVVGAAMFAHLSACTEGWRGGDHGAAL